MIEGFLQGLYSCLLPVNFLAMLLAVFLGIVIGALPGFGAATGLIIILPLTYSLDPAVSFVAMVGVYMGAEYGGSISSILINTPGTGGAVVTCFDGYPMAQKGLARQALTYSNISSFIGGVMGGLVMLFLLPPLAEFALKFGPPELFLMAVIGLSLVGSISGGKVAKGLASAALGVLLSTVGSDATTGFPRFHYESRLLIGGFPYIPVVLGLFSVPYLLIMLEDKGLGNAIAFGSASMRENFRVFRDVFREILQKHKMILLRSGIIGLIVGMIPGVGGAVATFIAYADAKRTSRQPELFGTGVPEGVTAPECCNNALIGGALIPTLAFGIPGSAAGAIFMGAIYMHGMLPGPEFMVKQAGLVYTLIAAVFVTSFIQLLYGAFTIGSLASVLRIPVFYLVPSVIVICNIGAYVVRGQYFDIQLFLIFGLLGYFLLKFKYNLAAIILGLILGNITEVSLMQAVTIARAKDGLLAYFFTRPLSLALMLFLLLIVSGALLRGLSTRRERGREAKAEAGATSVRAGWQGMRRYDALVSLLAIAGFLSALSTSRSFPSTAALFPQLSLLVLIACFLLILAGTLWASRSYAGEADPLAGMRWGQWLITIAIWVVYTFLISAVGFYASSLAFLLAASLYFYTLDKGPLSYKRLGAHLAYAVLFTVGLYLVFQVAFMVPMPQEILP